VDLSWLYFAMIFPLSIGMILREGYPARPRKIPMNKEFNGEIFITTGKLDETKLTDNAKRITTNTVSITFDLLLSNSLMGFLVLLFMFQKN